MGTLLNERLASVQRHSDFTHFEKLFLSPGTELSSTRPVKMLVNFHCEECQQLVQQIIHIWPNIHLHLAK